MATTFRCDRRWTATALLLAAATLAFVFNSRSAHGQLANTTWKGASGASWNTTGNWSGGATSGSNSHFVINGSLSGGSPVVLNTNPTIGGLTVASGFTLARSAASTAAQTLTVSASTATDTVFNNAGTISSGGASNAVTIAINNSAVTITNSGTIEATAGTALNLRSSAVNGAYTLTNTGGVLRTVGSGTLGIADTNGPVSFTGGSISNAAGTIVHRRTTTLTDVAFSNGGLFGSEAPTSAAATQFNVILAGSSSLSNSGTMRFTKDVTGTNSTQSVSLTFNSTTASLTNTGSMYFATIGTGTAGFTSGATFSVAVSSTITNNGVMTFESRSDTNPTSFSVNATQATLAGSGTLALAIGSGGTASQVRIAGGSGSELVNGTSHTIRGAGAFGNNGLEKFTNNGTLLADDATALAVLLRNGTNGTFTNASTGVVRASGAGGIVVSASNQFTNQGLLQVDGGSLLALGGAIFSTPGHLKVNGSLTANGPITIAGLLTGTGTVDVGSGRTVSSTGIWAPGNSIGSNAVTGNLALSGTSQFELGTPGTSTSAPGTSDFTAVSGTLTLGGALTLIDNAGANGNGSAAGGVYRLFTYNAVSGNYASVTTNPTATTRTSLSQITYGGSGTAAGQGVFLSIYNLASATSSQTVNLGNMYSGTTKTAAVTLTNSAFNNATYTETLSGSFSGVTTNFTATGSVSGITGQSGSSGTLLVGFGSGLAAGVQTGTATLALFSNAVNSSGLAQQSVGSQAVTITGTVWNPAGVNTLSAVSLTNVRVGGTFANSALTITNTAASGLYTENLGATGTTTGLASLTGSFSGLAGNQTSTAISVGLNGSNNTGSAGVKSGTATLSFTSTGGPGTASINSQAVAVTGTVWNAAAASSITGTYALGSFLVNTTGTQVLSITNTAPNNGFSESLNGSFGTLSGVTTNSGSFSLLGPGSTNTALAVSLTSGSAGNATGSAQVNFQTDGQGTSGLGVENLAAQTANFSATFLDRAVASFTSGSTTSSLLLDFNTVNVNTGTATLGFSLFNLLQTAGYTADLALETIVSGTGNVPYLSTNLAPFTTLAGGSSNSWNAFVSPTAQGTFTNTWTLNFRSASGGTVFANDLPQSLLLTVSVVVVPEPGTLALAAAGIAAAVVARRRRRG